MGARRLLAALPVVVLGFSVEAQAWWDAGHMVIAAVATRILSEAEKGYLEGPLRAWDFDFPNLSSLITAACWADHEKCSAPAKYCGGLRTMDSFEAFNGWHYVELVYNPQNITLSERVKGLPSAGTGAVWALERVTESLLGRHHTSAGGQQARPNRHSMSTNASDSVPVPWASVGHPSGASILNFSKAHFISDFAWNLALRLLIHILGDLHQPLHACEAVSEAHPHGDAGGSLIHVGSPLDVIVEDGEVPADMAGLAESYGAEALTLHALWDSCGGLLNQSWPTMSAQDALDIADMWALELPELFFTSEGRRLDLSFREIAEESHSICVKEVYSEFDWSEGKAAVPHVYRPSAKYVRLMQDVCKERVVLGGYRLGHLLSQIARRSMSAASEVKAMHSLETEKSTVDTGFKRSGQDAVGASETTIKNFPVGSALEPRSLFWIKLFTWLFALLSIALLIRVIQLRKDLDRERNIVDVLRLRGVDQGPNPWEGNWENGLLGQRSAVARSYLETSLLP